MKLVGKLDPQVISRVYDIGYIGTPFSQRYLKFNFYLEKLRLGTIKSPWIVQVNKGTAFLSFADETFKVYYSVKTPFFKDKALN